MYRINARTDRTPVRRLDLYLSICNLLAFSLSYVNPHAAIVGNGRVTVQFDNNRTVYVDYQRRPVDNVSGQEGIQ